MLTIILFSLGILILFIMFTLNKNFKYHDTDKKSLDTEVLLLKQKNEILVESNNSYEAKIKSLEQENKILLTEKITIQTKLKEIEEIKEKNARSFEEISNHILEKQSIKNHTLLNQILKPFKDNLENYEKELKKYYKEENEQRIALKTEMQHMNKTSKNLTQEAQNLTRALQSSNKSIGNWGEQQLKRLLDILGFIEHIDYTTQSRYISESDLSKNTMNIFDILIYLPDNQHIIIDAKMSLDSYQKYINCDNTEEKKEYLNHFIASTKSHIKDLSSKEYYKSKDIQTVPFTILFMPIESSYFTLMYHDTTIQQEAWSKNIILASAHTLIAILKSIAFIQNKNKQNNNFKKIINECSKMIDKFENFYDSLESVGNSINKAQDTYNKAVNQLKTGKGSVMKIASKIDPLHLIEDEEKSILTSIEQVKELGLITKKQ